MNVAAHQEKKKNKEMKTDKRRAGEKRKRKQATNFKKAVFSFCGRSGGSIAKKSRRVPGVTGTLGKPTRWRSG